MNKVFSIYESKTQLSKLVKRAKAGETILIGSYGQPEVILGPIPPQNKVKIGVWQHKAKHVNYDNLAKADSDIATMFNKSVGKSIKHKRKHQ